MPTTEVYQLVTEDVKRINLLRGGARSSKTHSLIQMSIKWLWTGEIGNKHIPKGIAIIARETFPALRRTVLREFINMMHSEGLMPYVKWRRSVHEFEYQGRQITFLSLDDESKVLGMQTVWFWINEGNPIQHNIFQQLLMRCEGHAFLDYNPFDEDGWINQELELKRLPNKGDVSLSISTFRMNPFLPPEMIDEIEYLKETDYELYQVYNQGNWAKVTGLIFGSFTEVPDMPDGKTAYGLDFGFTNDPTGLIQVTKIGKNLYMKELLYKKGLLTSELIDFMRDNVPKTTKIIADSADPKAIEEIRRAGFRIKASKKGPDSIRKGIDTIKMHKLFVTQDSVNLQMEFKRYKYKVDKDGRTLNEPIDMYNHLCDALRYCCEYIAKRSTFKIGNY